MKAVSKVKPDSSLPVSLLIETSRLSRAWIRHGVLGLPWLVSKSVLLDPQFEGKFGSQRFKDLIGQSILNMFDDLGPVYGKAGQIGLSRLSADKLRLAESIRLTRLYSDWPPMNFDSIMDILDDEIPKWRSHFKVDPHPLGVASMAQVHACVDDQGQEWVIKILKPAACKRLEETVGLIEHMTRLFEPVALTQSAKAMIRDINDLCQGFRREISLDLERKTIEKMTEKLQNRRHKVLSLPSINGEFCTDKVLTIERFRGVALNDVVSGKVTISSVERKKLARSVLQELLIQVFEMGLFHGDPHAGNLILLENGNLGLFDWGLAGELREADRRHIAAILKAVLVMDPDRLVEALYDLAQETPSSAVTREKIRSEVKKLAKKLQPNVKTGEKPSFCDQIEACLSSAAKLRIVMPEGLLLMAKSLVTIEGLAKGIDPEVPLRRIASPVLLKAAKPGFQELLSMTKNLPKIARRFWS